MSSSKIQSRNLDPNMDLAKESSVQQILEKVQNSGTTVGDKVVTENVIKSYSNPFEVVAEIPIPQDIISFASNDNYLYYTYTQVGETTERYVDLKILVLNKSDFSIKTIKTLLTGLPARETGFPIVANNNYVLIHPTSHRTTYWHQYDAETLEFVKTSSNLMFNITLATWDNTVGTILDPYDSEYAYCIGTPSSDTDRFCIYRINMSTLVMETLPSALTFNSLNNLYFTQDYIYCCPDYSSQYSASDPVVKINRNDFANPNTIGTSNANSLITFVSNGRIYGDNMIMEESGLITGKIDYLSPFLCHDKFGIWCYIAIGNRVKCLANVQNNLPITYGSCKYDLTTYTDNDYFYAYKNDLSEAYMYVLKLKDYGYTSLGHKEVE